MEKKSKSNMENNVIGTDVPIVAVDVSKIKVSRKFVGDEPLEEILTSVFENQVDNLVYKYYHSTRAKTVASHTTHSEGNEL
ncbi:hypothetical protein [Paenibacillus sp. MSJ-34]|uniref:hypothetical protein n=1 Tax=Paenibacillus sp. MSJ-34 TaxID=2841529 RepID=UPI001C11DF11|nr:hypothetical protein [Paenibacillus sp. MSJ-34]MBU5443552.1 hypothetical protein [Paenibacillus sp. MSJ-34]